MDHFRNIKIKLESGEDNGCKVDEYANVFYIRCNFVLLFLSSVPHYQAEY